MDLERLKVLILEIMNKESAVITEDTTFTDDLGADSLDLFQLIMELERQYDIELPEELPDRVETVGQLLEAVQFSQNIGE